MQIALTQKLAKALELKVPPSDSSIDSFFSWTANWTNVWKNRKTLNLLVLVNNATKFTTAVYEFKKKDLKNIKKIMIESIRNTMEKHYFNPEFINEYLEHCNTEVNFVKNSNVKVTSWLNNAGGIVSNQIGHRINEGYEVDGDTVGTIANYYFLSSLS